MGQRPSKSNGPLDEDLVVKARAHAARALAVIPPASHEAKCELQALIQLLDSVQTQLGHPGCVSVSDDARNSRSLRCSAQVPPEDEKSGSENSLKSTGSPDNSFKRRKSFSVTLEKLQHNFMSEQREESAAEGDDAEVDRFLRMVLQPGGSGSQSKLDTPQMPAEAAKQKDVHTMQLCDAARRGDIEGLRSLVPVEGVSVNQGELASRSRDLSPRSRDLPPRSRDLPPRSRDLSARSRDLSPRSRDQPPRSRDQPPPQRPTSMTRSRVVRSIHASCRSVSCRSLDSAAGLATHYATAHHATTHHVTTHHATTHSATTHCLCIQATMTSAPQCIWLPRKDCLRWFKCLWRRCGRAL